MPAQTCEPPSGGSLFLSRGISMRAIREKRCLSPNRKADRRTTWPKGSSGATKRRRSRSRTRRSSRRRLLRSHSISAPSQDKAAARRSRESPPPLRRRVREGGSDKNYPSPFPPRDLCRAALAQERGRKPSPTRGEEI